MAKINERSGADVALSSNHATLPLRGFYWRPIYAKLWWASAATFWLAASLSTLLRFGAFEPQNGLVGGMLILAFHPFTIILGLSLPQIFTLRQGIAFPWEQLRADENDDATDQELYNDEEIGSRRAVSSSSQRDVTDVRSPLNPVNPANRWWRERH